MLRRTVLFGADQIGMIADEGMAHTLQPASTVALVGCGDEGRRWYDMAAPAVEVHTGPS